LRSTPSVSQRGLGRDLDILKPILVTDVLNRSCDHSLDPKDSEESQSYVIDAALFMVTDTSKTFIS